MSLSAITFLVPFLITQKLQTISSTSSHCMTSKEHIASLSSQSQSKTSEENSKGHARALVYFDEIEMCLHAES